MCSFLSHPGVRASTAKAAASNQLLPPLHMLYLPTSPSPSSAPFLGVSLIPERGRGAEGGRPMASGPIFPAAWQIPVDFIVRKGYPGLTRGDLTVYDAYSNLRFRVRSRCLNSSPWRAKTLVDAVGNPLITCVRHQGGWQGFRGNSWDCKDMIFTAHKIAYSQFDSEINVFSVNGNWAQPSLAFRLKGSPFQRSCTIYQGDSVVAQTNPNYLLGKVVYSRHKFRLTVYPGIDHALVVSLLVIFFGH